MSRCAGRSADANGSRKGDTAFKFVKKEGAPFFQKGEKLKAGVVIWDQIDKKGTANDVTIIRGDTNGDGKADFQLEFTGLIKLEASDFGL